MDGAIKTFGRSIPQAIGDPYEQPVDISRPSRAAGPYVFASPHSGRAYSPRFLSQTALDPLTLRASEDAFVDELFADAPTLGAPLISARFPRAYLDANREPWELDPAMFDGPLPSWVNGRTARVAAGLGAVPRIVADGASIYDRPIPFAEAQQRVRRLHHPYHRSVEALLTETKRREGRAILVDCHSMPSAGAADKNAPHGRVDMVLGDRYGSSCASWVADAIELELTALGYRVARNAPYAGGYSTERYGRPRRGVHAIQIEINRSLYLDEARVALTPGYLRLRSDLAVVIARLIHGRALQAAE